MSELDEVIFKVKTDKATQSTISDTNTALPPSLGSLNSTLIMQ